MKAAKSKPIKNVDLCVGNELTQSENADIIPLGNGEA